MVNSILHRADGLLDKAQEFEESALDMPYLAPERSLLIECAKKICDAADRIIDHATAAKRSF